MSERHLAHDVHELCETGTTLYATALRDGRIRQELVHTAPCLLEAALLQPDVHDVGWLVPTAPALALPRLLNMLELDISSVRQQEARLSQTFGPLINATAAEQHWDRPTITVLSGLPRIGTAIDEAVSACCEEALAIQPGQRRQDQLEQGFPREQAVLDSGARMRTLYQHTNRHSPLVAAHYETLDGDVQVRTLDEVTERLLVFDRTVAFIPASKDRSLALEVRHPALIDYFVLTFDRLWGLATPLFPHMAPMPATDGITARQRAIAALVAEGETDARIAERLGMNVRTCRAHIARLAEALGSRSRGQLGYLIAKSGILEGRGITEGEQVRPDV